MEFKNTDNGLASSKENCMDCDIKINSSKKNHASFRKSRNKSCLSCDCCCFYCLDQYCEIPLLYKEEFNKFHESKK